MDHFNFSFILTYVYTKTLVLLLLCVVTFRDQPQGSQSCPAFTKTGIVQKNTCTMHFASDTSIIRTEIYFCTCQPNPPPSPPKRAVKFHMLPLLINDKSWKMWETILKKNLLSKISNKLLFKK